MSRNRLLVVLAILLTLLLSIPAAGASAATPSDQLADAIRFRAELGFDASPDHVAAMIAAGQMSKLGQVLDATEQQELVRRATLRQALEPALSYVDQHPDDFAGVYFDQSVGDLLLNVNVAAGAPSAVVDGFKALLPAGATVQYPRVQFSWSALTRVHDSLLSDVPQRIRYLAINVTSNRVDVTQTGAAGPLAALAAADQAAVSYEAHEEVVPSSCTSRAACFLPWRGGTNTVADGTNCTWGFNARPTTSSSTEFLTEAGHCSRLNKNVTHNGAVVNIAPGVDHNTFDMIGNQPVDALSAPLKIDNGAKNLIYISSSSTAYAITSFKSGANQRPGDSVCFSGAASSPGYKCGTITTEGVTVTYARPADNLSKTFTDLTIASMSNVAGDSGAPVFAGTLPQAFGILNARGTGTTYYSPIDIVMSELALRLCLNAACS